jgi:hypothetical protein
LEETARLKNDFCESPSLVEPTKGFEHSAQTFNTKRKMGFAGDFSTVVGVRIQHIALGISLGRVTKENQFLCKEQKKRGCAGDISTLSLIRV